jgi:hypothetical protein
MRLLSTLGLVLALLGTLVGLSGCASGRTKKKDYPVTVVRLLAEGRGGDIGGSVRLPRSGSMIPVNPKSFITEYDITAANIMDAELGKALVLQFTPEASRDFYRHTLTNQGLRIVTTINGQPVGARRIDAPSANGFWVTYVEFSEEADLIEIAKNIARTSADAREELAKKQ